MSTNQLVGLEPGGREVFSIRGLTKVIARLSVLKLPREVDLRVRAIDDSIYYSTNCTWNRYSIEVVREEGRSVCVYLRKPLYRYWKQSQPRL